MKKNISINISGIIFHIEEDSFNQLKEYLDSISNHFSLFDGSDEIIADIESRIAEIFIEKLKDNKQIITNKDISDLIATMGSIQDFQANSDTAYENTPTGLNENSDKIPFEDNKNKKLYRDTKRKLIGGVASGIANYFSLDPVWIRLLFIVLLFGVFIFPIVSAPVLVVYIVLWISLPGSNTLKEDKSMRKLYRNPDGKVIGGVSQGIGTFLDIDKTLIRILFVLSIFLGGTGLLIYILLWIILPEANSITDKVQMKGDKVTLENIDSSIKKAKEKDENSQEESTLAKVFLFPFKLIGNILKETEHVITPILKFSIQLLRSVIGIVITIITSILFFSLTFAAIVFLGIIPNVELMYTEFVPIDLISNSIPIIAIMATYFIVATPVLFLFLVGVSLLYNRFIITPILIWVLSILWIIGVVILSLIIPNILYQYKENTSLTTTKFYPTNHSSMYFDINRVEYEKYEGVKIKMKGYDGSELKIIEEYSAHGSNKKEATTNAGMIQYNILQHDSILLFDSNIKLNDDAVFRYQKLNLTLLIPYELKFKVSKEFADLFQYGFDSYMLHDFDVKENILYFNETGLDCITCLVEENRVKSRRKFYKDVLEESTIKHDNYNVFDFEDFETITIVGPFKISIAQGDDYRVALSRNKHTLNDVEIFEEDGHLQIAYNKNDISVKEKRTPLKLRIIMPNLIALNISEGTVGNIAGFEEEKMVINLSESSKIIIDSDINFLTLKLSSASSLNLIGDGNILKAKLSSIAQLKAYKFNANDVSIKVSSGAKAKVFVTETLSIKTSTLGEVNYRGGATVTREKRQF